MTSTPPTVGVLYPGEMGSAVAALLASRGTPVVTTLAGRGATTAAHCAASGAKVVASLEDVVRASDVLISLVVPSAAEAVAEQYCAAAHRAPRGAIYVDANSIAPARAEDIGRRVEAAGRSFVDASINGLAKNLPTSGTLYLSGRRAGEVAALFEAGARVKLLGDGVGRASAMKMLLGGLSKGMCALFAELALVAHEQGMLDEMVEAATRTYGGVTAVVERMLPTYARHAARRHTEMTELEATARDAGVRPRVIQGVVKFHEAMAEAIGQGPARDGAAEAAGAGDSAQVHPAPPAGVASLVRSLADRINASEVV